MARSAYQLYFPQKGFIRPRGKNTHVNPPLANLQGLVPYIVEFGADTENHQLRRVKDEANHAYVFM